jgi:lipopolysaccharide transport system permease protein
MFMTNLWEYRGLIKKIAITDLKIRYKSSILGFFWSLLQPLLIFLVLYIVFSSIFVTNSNTAGDGNANSGISGYPLFLLLGIVMWGFFDKATAFGLQSIVGKPNLVKKIFFPREVLVISACLTALMMTSLELVVFGVFMLAFTLFSSFMPGWNVLLIPVVLAIEFLFTLGIALAISSLNVRYRDVQYIWAVVIQAGFFLTPVMYSLSILRNDLYVNLLSLNPMAVFLGMARDTLIYNRTPQAGEVIAVFAVSVVILFAGWLIFRKFEPTFAEEV